MGESAQSGRIHPRTMLGESTQPGRNHPTWAKAPNLDEIAQPGRNRPIRDHYVIKYVYKELNFDLM